MPLSHTIPIRFSVVLTAAHCIVSTTKKLVVPSTAMVKPLILQDGTPYNVAGYRIHPGWKCDKDSCLGGRNGVDVNLALLKLDRFSDNQVICLNTDTARPANGVQLDNMGFGLGDDTFQGATMTTNAAACRDIGAAAGYFCSSIFELVGKEIAVIP